MAVTDVARVKTDCSISFVHRAIILWVEADIFQKSCRLLNGIYHNPVKFKFKRELCSVFGYILFICIIKTVSLIGCVTILNKLCNNDQKTNVEPHCTMF